VSYTEQRRKEEKEREKKSKAMEKYNFQLGDLLEPWREQFRCGLV